MGRIAFVSNHEKDPDQSGADDIFVIEARPGSSPNKLISVNSSGGQHLAWSPDGRRVVTASVDKTARIWDVATAKELVTLRGHEGIVLFAELAPMAQK